MNKTFNKDQDPPKDFSSRFENYENHGVIRELISHVPIGIAYVNKSYVIEYANAPFVRHFAAGKRISSLAGFKLATVVGQAQFEQDLAFYESALRGNRLVVEQSMASTEKMKLSFVPESNQQLGFYLYAENLSEPQGSPNIHLTEDEIEKNELASMRQALLQNELEHRNRELTSQSLFLKQKDGVLKDVQKSLEKLLEQVNGDTRHKIRSLIQRISNNMGNEQDWDNFKLHFERIHPSFFDKLIDKYPKLTQSELRHCAYLKMNLSPKQVAKVLNVSSKSVDMARYRLKKKINIQENVSLIQYVNSL